MRRKVAVVLSGGGSRGAYEAGVWKALRKLNIKYDIVTGTSIGAINGILMVQKDFKKCIKTWESISLQYIYNEKDIDKLPPMKIYKKYLYSFLTEGGVDNEKIKYVVVKLFNPLKFYLSKVDYGIVTYNVSAKKPKFVKKKEVKPKELIDYIVASATCFPAFKIKKIDEKIYIDGGIYDNLPINLAIEMGATEVIAVDLKAPGIKKRVKDKNIKIVTIKPRNKINSFLIFNSDDSKRMIRYGYNDAMKTFGKLDGDKYTFENGNLTKNLSNHQYPLVNILELIFNNKNQKFSDKLLSTTDYYQIIKGNLIRTKRVINKTIEYIGVTLGIDDSLIYNIDEYNSIVAKKLLTIENINIELIEQKIKKKDIKSLFNTALIIKYIYNKLLLINDDKVKKELRNLAILLPKEFMSAVYIYVVNENNFYLINKRHQ